MKEIKSIGAIGNYYGGLYIGTSNNKYYWLIENYDTDLTNPEEWDEISEELYNLLLTQESRK